MAGPQRGFSFGFACPLAPMAPLAQAPLEFAPGTSEHYSNEAFVMASHIVEHVSGL